MSPTLMIDGHSLGLDEVEVVARNMSVRVEITQDARGRVSAARDFIEAKVATGERGLRCDNGVRSAGRCSDRSPRASYAATQPRSFTRIRYGRPVPA